MRERVYIVIQETTGLLAAIALIPAAVSTTFPEVNLPVWLVGGILWLGVVSLFLPSLGKWWLGVTRPINPDDSPEETVRKPIG